MYRESSHAKLFVSLVLVGSSSGVCMTISALGPWPLGQDSVSANTAIAFQLATEDRPTRPRLKTATNVDIDQDGWPRLRKGTLARLTGTNYLNAFSGAGLLLLQDQGAITKVTPGGTYSSASLVAGLSSSLPVEFLEWNQGVVLWTNSATGGIITSAGAAKNWGLGVPGALTLGSTSGSLTAGKYRVVCTYVDAQGVEGGAQYATEITIAASKSITVDFSVGDSNATHVNIYVSPGPDQNEMYWNQKVVVGALPATITNARISRRSLRTQHLRGPIWGSGLAKFHGYVLGWTSNVVFRSEPLNPHLWNPFNVWQFEADVQGVCGLESGVYVATANGLHWVIQNGTNAWQVQRLDTYAYAAGGTVVDGSLIVAAQTNEKVALFASQDGLVIGKPGGSVVYPTQSRLTIDAASSSVKFLYREYDDIRQILMFVT